MGVGVDMELNPFDKAIRQGAYWMQRKFTVGALVRIDDGEGRIVLVKQAFRQRARWGLPGGFVRKNETLMQAARREVAEETGLQISELELVDSYVQPWTRHVDVVFRTEVEEESPLGSAVREIKECQWVPAIPEAMPRLTIETAYFLSRMDDRDQ